MTFILKIVPDAEPNADGRWIKATKSDYRGRGWLATEMYFAPDVPPGHHLVAVDCIPTNRDEAIKFCMERGIEYALKPTDPLPPSVEP
jgi:hypothetical protein